MDNNDWSGNLAIGFEYQRSFHGKDIAKSLFGRNTLVFQGSHVGNRSATALVAENFGLSQDFNGSISFSPRIQNYNLHFQSRFDFGCWLEGLYGEVNFTFAHQKRNLFDDGGKCGCDPITTGTSANTPFPVGYMTGGSTTVTPVTSIKEALKGQFLFGDMQTTWKFGKFAFCDQTINKVAGVGLILGYDFWKNDCGHFGAFFQYVAPTGNRPDAAFVFAPVSGNGHHNELYGGVTAHYELWKDDCDRTITAYLNGYVGTLLKDCQARSFDFKGKGCLSRYMLLKELTPSTDTTVGFTYAGSLINAINYTTRNVNVKVNVKGDASLRFVYHDGSFNFALGYNIYGQSGESLCNVGAGSPCSAVDTSKHYGFKGIAGADYYAYTVGGGLTTAAGVATLLNATQSNADIVQVAAGSGLGFVVDVTGGTEVLGATNVGVDYTNAYRTPSVQANAVAIGTATTAVTDAFTSNPAQEIVATAANLNLNSGKAPRQLTNKGFATMDYTWSDCDWAPSLGIGAEVEGGSRVSDLKQWGVWIKGGVSF